MARSAGSWRNRAFLGLWTARSVSTLGSQVTIVALPLTAVLALHASALQMGILRALAAAPALALGLLAGAWVDRVRRRPLLVGTDLAQALVLGSIPLAAVLGLLHLEQLYAAAFICAALTLVFDVAAQAYVPMVVAKADLTGANSRLASSSALAGLVGPALGGALVQVLTAPVAILVDCASFVVSALAIGSVGTREPPVTGAGAHPRRAGLGTSIGEGVRLMIRNRTLLALASSAGLFNLFDGMVFAVYILYATRQLAVPPAALGAIIAAGGAGGLLGAFLAGTVARRLGWGRALVAALGVAAMGEFLIAFAAGPATLAAGLLLVAELVVGIGAAVYGIGSLTLRQLAAPAASQGRVHAVYRMLGNGLAPVGALLGGVLGQAQGLRVPLVVGAAGTLAATALILMSPVRSWRPLT